jgi:hypothetical protein
MVFSTQDSSSMPVHSALSANDDERVVEVLRSALAISVRACNSRFGSASE